MAGNRGTTRACVCGASSASIPPETEPEGAERLYVWQMAVGLQAVDGLKPSEFLLQTARRNIAGDIGIDEARRLVYAYYENRELPTEQELQCNYGALSMPQAVNLVGAFISKLWQIHPFREGNTRTMAVLLVKYLRFRGFEVDNTPFARHSWYFRNALVRANYHNPHTGVQKERVYLMRFLRNLLMGETHELKKRYLIIPEKPVTSAATE